MDVSALLSTATGRLSRKPYCMALLALTATTVAISAAGIMVGQVWPAGLAILLMMYPAVIIGIKRCHDRDHSGWFVLIGFIPIGNLWLMIELIFLPGTTGSNRFGPDTLDASTRVAYGRS